MGQHVITFGGGEQPPLDQSAAAIIPVPLEATVSYGQGSSLGPGAIMMASAHMESYDELLREQPCDRGIYTHCAVNIRGEMQEVLNRVQEAVAAELQAGRLPVVLGGEHTVTLGALAALVAARGTDFTVLTLDAHLDLRDTYHGQRLSHACVMRRALEMGLDVRHVGVRACSADEARYADEHGLRTMWAHWVRQGSEWVAEALRDLEGDVYLSLDADGLDPGIMPATGTPEPGGLNWDQVTDWLLAVGSKHRIIGMDFVELAPINGLPASDFLAARMVYRALGLALRGPD